VVVAYNNKDVKLRLKKKGYLDNIITKFLTQNVEMYLHGNVY